MAGRTIVGGMVIIAGIAAIALFDWSTTLTCDRASPTSGSCQLIQSNGLGSRTQTLTLSRLQGAKVETKQVELGDRLKRTNAMYRVVLVAQGTEIPLTNYFTGDRPPKEAMASQISTFLQDSTQSSLSVRQGDRSRVFLVGGILIVLGIAIARFAPG